MRPAHRGRIHSKNTEGGGAKMPDTITAIGHVGTEPTLNIVGNGLARLTFRLASTQRKYNREASSWENGETNWYTIVAFRWLAENSAKSLVKGDRVVVTGRLRVSSWEKEDKHGTAVEIVAEGIGHDLAFGTSSFTKTAGGSSSQEGGAAVGGSQAPADQPVVDSDGWALPGGAHGSAEAPTSGADYVAHGSGNDAEAVQAELEFADAEPPF
jgi:single-strand DNA-binding protein